MPYVLRKHRFKDTFNEANPIHNGIYMKHITSKMKVKNGAFKMTSNMSVLSAIRLDIMVMPLHIPIFNSIHQTQMFAFLLTFVIS